MKKSIGLLSALVVSTTFIVNCQKAPDKRRVRPSGGSGAGVQTDIANEKATLPTKVCSKEVLDLYKVYYKNKETIKKTVNSAASTEAEKESYKKLGVETLAKCDEIITALKTENNEGCFMDKGVKDTSNALMATSMQNECNGLGKKLKTDVDLDSSYNEAAKELAKSKADAKKVEEKFIGSDKAFTISEQALNMMYEGNTNLGQFIVDGEIKSSQSTFETALAASKTVCTAIGKGITKDQTLTGTVLKFTSFEQADKSNLSELGLEFKGKATMINFVLHSEGDVTTAGAFICLNLDAAKLSVEKIEEVLGKVLLTQPATKVTTEVTGGTPAASATAHASDKLTAAQPEGSPQQKILDQAVALSVDKATKEAEQKAADKKAKEDAEAKAAAEAKAKEAQPAVALVPAAGVSSPAAAAQVEAEGKVSKEELASMKEKAERLEKEAKDAEAEVTKLETEKAKAEDIDQAKAKARIARESANSAKAEYEAAVKA